MSEGRRFPSTDSSHCTLDMRMVSSMKLDQGMFSTEAVPEESDPNKLYSRCTWLIRCALHLADRLTGEITALSLPSLSSIVNVHLSIGTGIRQVSLDSINIDLLEEYFNSISSAVAFRTSRTRKQRFGLQDGNNSLTKSEKSEFKNY